MSEELNATCSICGKRYHVCHTCKEITSFTPWRTITDTRDHYMIFLALSEYTKIKNKAKAKNELSRCDLSELETFDNDVKRVIKEILKEDEPKKTVQKVMYKKPVSVKTDEVKKDDIE